MDLTQTFPLQYNALESFGDFMQEDKNIFYSPNSHKCVYPRNIFYLNQSLALQDLVAIQVLPANQVIEAQLVLMA